MGTHYPQLEGLIPTQVVEAIRLAFDDIYKLRDEIKKIPPPAQLQSIQQIRASLEATGAAPINITGLSGNNANVASDIHANRPAASAAVVGDLFYETDRSSLFLVRIVGGANAWVFVDGMMDGTFALRPADLGTNDEGFLFFANGDSPAYNHVWRWTGSAWTTLFGIMRGTISPDQKPAGLGTGDTEFRFYSTDFDHVYRWAGAAWEYAPEDEGSGFVRLYAEAPNKGVWQVCDGSVNVTRSTPTGTTGVFTVPNYTTPAYIKAGTSYVGAPAAASGLTASEATHTHDVDPPDTASGVNSASQVVQSGTGVTVAAHTHTHQVDIAQFTSASGTAHVHGPDTIELRRTQWIAYFRL